MLVPDCDAPPWHDTGLRGNYCARPRRCCGERNPRGTPQSAGPVFSAVGSRRDSRTGARVRRDLVAAIRLVGRAMGVEIAAPSHPHSFDDPMAAIAAASKIRIRPVELSGDWW